MSGHLHISAPRLIDDLWIRVNGKDRPLCMYCGRTVGKGGYADPNFPFIDNISYHKACKRKARREGKE